MAAVPAGVIARAARARLRLASLLIALAGCAQSGHVPVAERSPVFRAPSGSYVVRAGDTLYSIAWRFGLDYKALAAANDLRAPYTIRSGQRIGLEVRSVASQPAPPSAGREPTRSGPPASGWRAPTTAPVRRAFGNGNRGIDYALAADDRVRAAATGEVVYAGSGLGGYRRLVIVKHDPAYLSAYSVDRPTAVREGQRVKVGEPLADTLERGHRTGVLHFEIRRNGEPVDPGALIGR